MNGANENIESRPQSAWLRLDAGRSASSTGIVNGIRSSGITVIVRSERHPTTAGDEFDRVAEAGNRSARSTPSGEVTMDQEWTYVFDGFRPEEEPLREVLCVLGNGYVCTRGAPEEVNRNGIHYPGTYLAGGYNRLVSQIGDVEVENEDLVNLPNWLPLAFRIGGGEWVSCETVQILDYRQELRLRSGTLFRRVRFRDHAGRTTTMTSQRLVHMGNPHLAAIQLTIVPEDWTGEVEFCASIDGRVTNAGVQRYRDLANRHLETVAAEANAEHLALTMRTVQSRLEVAMAARTVIGPEESARPQVLGPRRDTAYVAHYPRAYAIPGREITAEKVVAIYNSRDRAISDPGSAAIEAIGRAGRFSRLLESHRLAWEHLWRRYDIQIADAPDTNLVLRLHIFHLLQTASLHTIDLDTGVPARGWHGEAYRGHIFWDELFIFPYINYRFPEVTRALLLYRYRRLPEARENARKAGLKGALYPWQSGSSGREETQALHLNPRSGRWLPDNSHLQRHINAGIVYNLWQYFRATNDTEFLKWYGAEMIIEIARMFASLAEFDVRDGRYDVRNVMGPDEYHDGYPEAEPRGVDNNAYTNVMICWVLSRALEVLDFLPGERRQELVESLKLQPEEQASWDHIRRRLRIPFHDDGIISQFEGYEKLAEFDWEGYRQRYGDISRLDRILEAENDTPNRYKVSKQADVLMLFYLFSADDLAALFRLLDYNWDPAEIPRNIDYYLARTCHGSTLSRVVHSWVLARSDRERAWDLFCEALATDVNDVQGGTTPEGIHLGAMAGTIDIIQRAFTGLEPRGEVLRLNPVLPVGLQALEFRIRYRDHNLDVAINRNEVTIASVERRAEPIQVVCGDASRELAGGETVRFGLPPGPRPGRQRSDMAA